MRRRHPFRTTALLLLALSGGLSTGLPSHHHGDEAPVVTDRSVVSIDHHSHGTRLVETDDRTPSGTPQTAVASLSEIALSAPPAPLVSTVEERALRPTGRAPPPGAPRAPPLPA